MPTTQKQLEVVADEVLTFLKGVKHYSDARIAVIGGLAIWKYLPTGRTTQDVDFIINLDSAPKGMKQELLAMPNSPFFERAQYFYFQPRGGPSVQIDICPELLAPYMPVAATKLKDIPKGVVPYISAVDLIVFKIHSCGLRAQVQKKRVDALDAQNLLTEQLFDGPITLTDHQKSVVEPCIQDVVEYGDKSESWWKKSLRLTF